MQNPGPLDVLTDGEDQLIILPESLHFPDNVEHVRITRIGNARLVEPVDPDGLE